jgi:hypothetical protein
MEICDFGFKTWIYSFVVSLLYVLVEWVDSISFGSNFITLFLKGVF